MCILYAFFANQNFLCYLYYECNYVQILLVYLAYQTMNCHNVKHLGIWARVVHDLSCLLPFL